LKDKAFLTFLGQNPPFGLRLKTGFSPPFFRGIHRGSSKYWPNPSISFGTGQQGWLAFSLNVGLDETTKNCIRDEQTAQTQLEAQWSQFAASDKSMCTGEVTSTVGDGIPASYVELLTCVQGQQLVKKLNK